MGNVIVGLYNLLNFLDGHLTPAVGPLLLGDF